MLLEEDLTIRILMIDPDVIFTNYHGLTDKRSIIVTSNFFDDYFDRKEYCTDIKASYNRLVEFISTRKRYREKKGKVILKKYPHFIPMNVTIIDEISDKKSSGRMLIEWCFPFSDWRLSSRLSRSQHKEFFDTISKNVEELWNGSQYVIDDSYLETSTNLE